MKEEWKKVKNFEKYEISNLGRVRHSLGDGNYRLLKGSSIRGGYILVTFSTGHRGQQREFLIHRLVAEYFLPNPDNLWTVKHIDGNTSENRVSNLMWTGPSAIERTSEKRKRIGK